MCGVTHISPTGVAYDFCTLPVFRPLARISFQSFLWHIVILRIVAGYFRQPVYISSFYLVRMFIVYTFLMSNAKHFSAVQRAVPPINQQSTQFGGPCSLYNFLTIT